MEAMTRDELLQNVKSRLSAEFGDRLKGLLLYGSEARGEARPDSDYDFLVLLQGPVRLGADLKRIIAALYDLQLELVGTSAEPRDRLIHASPVDADVFAAQEYFLYQNAKQEGVWL